MKQKKPNPRFGIFAHRFGTLAEKAAIGHKSLLLQTIRLPTIDCKIYFLETHRSVTAAFFCKRV
jgi:hypothetical protein